MISVTPTGMRRIDEAAINRYGIASIALMENAGSAVAETAKRVLSGKNYKKICILCGKGNNGGDGLVASRRLIKSGYEVDSYILAKETTLREDAKFNLALLKRNGYRAKQILTLKDAAGFINNFNYCLVIDAVFGTGFSGKFVSEPARTLISFLNSANCKVVSVDIPSGLNGNTGKVEDVAVRADITVTLGMPKKGFFLNDGPMHTGKLIVETIGFPKSLLQGKRLLKKSKHSSNLRGR